MAAFFGHHVVQDDSRESGLGQTDLHDRIVYLQRAFDLVSAEEALAWLRAPQKRERLAVLTFDDGYADNLTNGLPVFRDAGCPVTVFVATEPVLTGGGFWPDRVRRAVKSTQVSHPKVEWFPEPLALTDAASRERAAGALVGVLKHNDRDLREARTEQLLEILEVAPAGVIDHDRALTPAELAELAGDPLVTIGAHSHTHTTLTACPPEGVAEELGANAAALEEITGVRPRLLSYPKGSHSDSVRAIVADMGFEAAFTVAPEVNRPGGDRFTLGRFPLGQGSVLRLARSLVRAGA